MKYWLYRLKWHLAKYITWEYPLHVDFELSTHCNLSCSFCPHSEHIQDFKKGFMDFDRYKQIIDEIAGKVPSIKFNLRGESTLHPDFDLFLKYAHKKFIDIRINTNGQYRNKAVSLWMAQYCTDISFSVDAFYKDTYKEKRGGDFQLLENNILDTIRMVGGYQHRAKLTLSYVYTSSHEYVEIAKFRMLWVARYHKVKFNIRAAMDRVTLKEQITKKGKIKKLGDKVTVGRKDCLMPRRRLVVTHDFKVGYCCLLWHKPSYLPFSIDSKEVKLLDYWNHPSLLCIRDNLKFLRFDVLPKMCKNCDSSESYKWSNL